MHILLLIALYLQQGPADYLIRHFTIDDGLPVNAINDIVQDADGYLYLSTYDGLVRFDGYRFEVFNSGNTPAMRSNRLAGLELSDDGTLWIYHVTGLITIKQGGLFSTYRPDSMPLPIRTPISKELKGKFGEVIQIDYDQIRINGKVVLEGSIIQKAMVDREGSIWVGTRSDGLYQIRVSHFSNIGPQQVDGIRNVYSLAEEPDGSIWACSFWSGIYRITGDTSRRWTPDNSGLETFLCKYVHLDSDGTLYASMNDQTLWVFRNGRWNRLTSFDRIPGGRIGAVEAIHRRGDQLFMGASGTLVIMEDGRFRLFDDSRPSALQGIQVIVADSRGVMYAGTAGNGLTRIDGDTYRTYTPENAGLNSAVIRDVFVQSDDTLWVVHESLGLNRLVLDDHGEVRSTASITMRDGLPQNSLHRMLADDLGHVWISGNSGLIRIPLDALNAYADGTAPELQALGFNERDGMIDREANGGVQSAGIRAADGRLWFPNQGGITIVYPAAFSADYGLDVPPPVFETMELSDSLLYIRDRDVINVPLNERDVRVRFAVPNFVNQDRLRFTYLLEGVNERWQDATEFRQAVFTGVPPGRHVLRIRSQFIGGEPVESRILIVIPPVFHETTWFGLSLLLGILAILFTGYKIRIRSLEDEEKRLQNRVEQQTEELRRAADEKQRFFTGITHELKTPLSLIMGPLGDMMDEPATHDRLLRERLSMMHRNSHRLKNLVDQILDVSKLNAHAITLTLQPVALAEFTRQIIGQFQSNLEQMRVSVDLPATEFSERIYVDQEAWERILINLASNAIKFSPPGGTIWVAFHETDTDVSIRVKDEGMGIPAEHRPKIFEYLYQVEGAKAAEGTGIGLYLVKGLIDEMGGSIHVDSEPGEWTEFTVTLRKGYAHFGAAHRVLHEPITDVISKTDTVKPTFDTDDPLVLVVEDNDDFRTYLHSILHDRHRVLLAENGVRALEILKTHTPDLILSDIMMPVMNGLEFVRQVRSMQPFEHLPVIFLTARDQDVDIRAGLSTGADIYLTKPIRSAMLLSQITAILRRERLLRKGVSSSNVGEPEFLKRVREIIYRQLGNPSLTVNQLADALFMSRGKLYMEWRKVNDVSLNEYINRTRLTEAKTLIDQQGFSVQDAARAVGFSDANYFSTSYKKHFGHPPTRPRS